MAVSAGGLAALQRGHLYTVPFENLDIDRGVAIVLDEDALVEKVVAGRRGGFCYELNGAFAWLLEALGFRVRRLAANVHGDGGWGIDFDHMLLAVDLEEPWLADVGFGDNFVEPLTWVEGEIQEQAVGAFRLEREDDFWILARRGGDGWVRQYRFRERTWALADFEPGCRFHQGPESHFTSGAVCSLARPDGRVTLRRDRLIETVGAERTETPIAGRDQWCDALAARFGIRLDEP